MTETEPPLAVATPDARKRGARHALIGLVLFLPGLALFLVARDWLLSTFGTVQGNRVTVSIPKWLAVVIGGPMTAGYALLVTGTWRALFGARGQQLTPAWSALRILFGLVVTFGMIVVAAIVMRELRGVAP